MKRDENAAMSSLQHFEPSLAGGQPPSEVSYGCQYPIRTPCRNFSSFGRLICYQFVTKLAQHMLSMHDMQSAYFVPKEL
jgi:hypothetical protein